MLSKIIKAITVTLMALVLHACVTLSNERFALRQETITENYSQIRKIVVEEAANNGFSELTSEIKPTIYNDWKGQLFFQLKTTNGTDQLFVKFQKADNGVTVWIHGAGTRSNPDGAAKAIQARLSQFAPAGQPTQIDVLKKNQAQNNLDTVGSPSATIDIATAQKLLKKKGYDVGSPDGKIGKMTQAAIKKFQIDNGLKVTGTLTPETVTQLQLL